MSVSPSDAVDVHQPAPPSGPTADLLARVADALPWPLMVLLANGVLVHANRAAQRALHLGRPVRLTAAGRVEPAAPRALPGYEAALAAAAQDGESSFLRWSDHATAMLRPLACEPGSPTALLLALNASDGRTADVHAFAQLHRLSAAETRVLLRLALGESTTTAAAALGVTAATVRSQIASLRRKTGHATVQLLLQSLAALPPLARQPDLGPVPRGQ